MFEACLEDLNFSTAGCFNVFYKLFEVLPCRDGLQIGLPWRGWVVGGPSCFMVRVMWTDGQWLVMGVHLLCHSTPWGMLLGQVPLT